MASCSNSVSDCHMICLLVCSSSMKREGDLSELVSP